MCIILSTSEDLYVHNYPTLEWSKKEVLILLQFIERKLIPQAQVNMIRGYLASPTQYIILLSLSRERVNLSKEIIGPRLKHSESMPRYSSRYSQGFRCSHLWVWDGWSSKKMIFVEAAPHIYTTTMEWWRTRGDGKGVNCLTRELPERSSDFE